MKKSKITVETFFMYFGIGIVVVMVLLILVPLLLFACINPLLNDARAARIEKNYEKIVLPSKTEFLGTNSFCGNSSGTGNHVEIWAGMLIRTELPEPEVRQYFKEYYSIWPIFIEEDGIKHMPDEAFVDTIISGIADLIVSKNQMEYYLIGDYYEPITQIDMRGY